MDNDVTMSETPSNVSDLVYTFLILCNYYNYTFCATITD